FVTIEDESGSVNLIVWRDIAERQRKPLLAARLLQVNGVLQRHGEVMHVVAQRLIDRSRLIGTLTARARNFHGECLDDLRSVSRRRQARGGSGQARRMLANDRLHGPPASLVAAYRRRRFMAPSSSSIS